MKQRYESGYSILLYYSWITDGWLVLLAWPRLRYRALCHVTPADRRARARCLESPPGLPVTAPAGLMLDRVTNDNPLRSITLLVICHHMDQTHGTPPGGHAGSSRMLPSEHVYLTTVRWRPWADVASAESTVPIHALHLSIPGPPA